MTNTTAHDTNIDEATELNTLPANLDSEIVASALYDLSRQDEAINGARELLNRDDEEMYETNHEGEISTHGTVCGSKRGHQFRYTSKKRTR